MTPFLTHSTPSRSRRSLSKVSTNSGEAHSTGLLYTWRRLAQQGELSLAPVPANSPGFIAVEIVPEIPPRAEGAGVMIVELPGARRVRVDRHVDTEALRRVLAALGVAS